MNEYHKIDTVFKRDPETNHKTLLIGDYSQDAFAYLAGNEWVFTEKVDGTNVRVMIGQGVSGVEFGGKTDNAQMPTFLATELDNLFYPQRDALMAAFPDGACFYGEGYGPRIQKGGGNYRSEVGFVLFDVRVGEWWLQREAVEGIAAQFGLDIVPIIGRGTLAEMVRMAELGITSTWGNFAAEGIVARPAVELKSRSGHRIITKIKSKDFATVASRKATAV